MINKYAEIRDRLVLYNACKGILRVKTAGNVNWAAVLKGLNKAKNVVSNYGGKAVAAAKTVNDKLKPIRDVANTAGKYTNKAYNVVANPIKKGLNFLGSEQVQKNMAGLRQGANLLSTGMQMAGQGRSMMGQMAEADIADKQRELESLRLQAQIQQLQNQIASQQAAAPQQQQLPQQQLPQEQQKTPQQETQPQEQVDPSMYQQQQ